MELAQDRAEVDVPALQARGVMPGRTKTLGAGSRPCSLARWYASSAALLRSSSFCCSALMVAADSASMWPALRLPSTPLNTLPNSRLKRPNVPSAVATVAAASLPLRAAAVDADVVEVVLADMPRREVGLRIWRGWLCLRTAGVSFSSLKPSMSFSMPMSRSFHSSSGGGRMLLFVFVCSLKRLTRSAGVSSLMATRG